MVLSGDGGTSWISRTSKDASDLYGVSCNGRDRCVAVGDSARGPIGDAILTTRNGGTSWRRDHSYQTLFILNGVSCPSADRCVAVGDYGGRRGNIFSTIDGGISWHPQFAQTTENLLSVSCPSPARCVAVGENGAIVAGTISD